MTGATAAISLSVARLEMFCPKNSLGSSGALTKRSIAVRIWDNNFYTKVFNIEQI